MSSEEEMEMMSAEVVNSNPYSQKMALQQMGKINNYEEIGKFTVVVVGVGGVGGVTAEMLTRCGIGKLILFDYNEVKLNETKMKKMNSLFYKPAKTDMSNVEAATLTLKKINPDVKVEFHYTNITLTTQNKKEEFLNVLKTGGINGDQVDLLLSCVNNFEERMTINTVCNELGLKWFDSVISDNAVCGHIQYIVPGESACYACAPPMVLASEIDKETLKKDGVCAANLPTTVEVDKLLSCVNNFEERMTINTVCNELGLKWFDSGVSDNAVCGHNQYIMLGESACYAGEPPLELASEINKKTLKKDGVCAANLPTAVEVIAGLLVQNTLKKLLGFGTISWYLRYNALSDFFPNMMINPNPNCTDSFCIKRQEEFKIREKEKPKCVNEDKLDVKIVHEDNYAWGISLADESTVSNNTTADLIETSRTENVNKNNIIKSEKNLLVKSADQTAPNEESFVKDTD